MRVSAQLGSSLQGTHYRRPLAGALQTTVHGDGNIIVLYTRHPSLAGYVLYLVALAKS